MGIKEDYNMAVELVKQGKYEQARRLLLIHDHPKANALLAKINEVMASTGDTPKRKTDALDIVVGLANVFITGGIVGWWAIWIDNSIAFDLDQAPMLWAILIAVWIALIYVVNRIYKRMRK